MEGFSKLPKMQCYKEGGSVMAKNLFKSKDVESKGSDMAQDKKLIKKAFKQHDKAEHDKEPTEIKLKKGGRSKKEVGTVKKYKAGGNVDESMKAAGALDMLKKIKPTGKKKAMAPSKATEKPMMSGIDDMLAMKKGKSVKKYKEGGSIKNMADGRLTQTMGSAPSRGAPKPAMPAAMEETPQEREARRFRAQMQAQALSSLPQSMQKDAMDQMAPGQLQEGAAPGSTPIPPMAPPQQMAPQRPPMPQVPAGRPMPNPGIRPIPGSGAISSQEQQMLMRGGM
jgi:hypothetical protein